jgi:hypothetical protein
LVARRGEAAGDQFAIRQILGILGRRGSDGAGDKDVEQLTGGGLVEFAFDKGGTGLQIRGGYSWLNFADHSRETRPYIGAGLYRRF